MTDEKQAEAQPEGPSLAHGPNPALSAQEGTEQRGYSQPEYPEATAEQSVPGSDHGEMEQQTKDRVAELKDLEKAARRDPDAEGTRDEGGVKLGASGAEQAAATPNPGEASDPLRKPDGPGKPASGPVGRAGPTGKDRGGRNL